jgi:hypothetical protein
MTILPFSSRSDASAFDPENLHIILEMAKLGERDRDKLRDAALAHLPEANIRKERN